MGKWKEMAFPTATDNGHTENQDGMALRDYFAAKAMQSLIITTNTQGYDSQIIYTAYQYADAAINARDYE